MLLVITMALIILSANGVIIPPLAWVCFGIGCVLGILKTIIDVIQKKEKVLNELNHY